MADDRLRELERRFRETGAAQDEAAWLRERLRAGALDEERLRLAALFAHDAALLVCESEPLEGSKLYAALADLDRSAVVRAMAALAVASRCDLPLGAELLAAADAWIACPCDEHAQAAQEASQRAPQVGVSGALRGLGNSFLEEMASEARDLRAGGASIQEFLRHARAKASAMATNVVRHLPRPQLALGVCAFAAWSAFWANGRREIDSEPAWLEIALEFFARTCPDDDPTAAAAAEVVPWALGYRDPVAGRLPAGEDPIP